MPNNNSDVVVYYGTQSDYDSIASKNQNAVYFTTDTKKFYVGNIGYADSNGIPIVTGKTGEVPKFKSDGTLESTGFTLGKSVPSDAKFIDTTYSAATSTENGLMTAADKTKLNSIETEANKTVVDNALSSTSTNPVQNKIVDAALANKSNTNHTHTTVNGHTVESDVPANAVFTDTTYNVATTSENGLMSSADKTKLNGIESGAEVNTIVSITVNGAEIVPVNKTVALTVIDNTVNNLTNYYKKTETYTQDEVNDLVSAISSLNMEIVQTLPTTGSTSTIYLVPTDTNNIYSQYIYTNNAWASIGSTEVDLTNYYTKTQIDTILSSKQDTLTFDTEPTANSVNPVTSGGVYTALAGKSDTSHTHTTVNGHTVESDVPENAVFTDTTYSNATPVSAGLMSAADKEKLDEIDNVITGTITDNIGTGEKHIYKVGKIVSLDFRLYKEAETTISNNQVVGSVPLGYRPKSNVFMDIQNFDSAGSHALVIVESNGNIKWVNGQTVSRLDTYLHATWITD